MAKGAASKDIIMSKILEVFEGSFKNDKEIRIPMVENGEEIQIKVTLTAAKTNVENANGTSIVGAKETSNNSQLNDGIVGQLAEPTAEEKANVENLLTKLGL